MKCCECKFWLGQLVDDDGVDAYGECMRYPPTTKQDGSILTISSYSKKHYLMDTSKFEIITHRDQWCGEYQEYIKEYKID